MTQPLMPGEMPKEMFIQDPFVLDPYFEPDQILPKGFLSRLEKESEVDHIERTRRWLLNMS